MKNTTETGVRQSGIKIGAVLTAVTKLSREALVNVLFMVKGVTFIGAETTTIPDMNKGGREHLNYMLDNVVKDSFIRAMLGFDYPNRRDTLAENEWIAEAVEAAIAEGIDPETVKQSVKTMKEYSTQEIEKFEVKERKWGKHMPNPYTGKLSRIMVHHTKKDKKTGELIPESYKRYMQVEILSAKTPVYRYKDTGKVLSEIDLAVVKQYLKDKPDDDLVIRDYSIEAVKKININKRRYEIV